MRWIWVVFVVGACAPAPQAHRGRNVLDGVPSVSSPGTPGLRPEHATGSAVDTATEPPDAFDWDPVRDVVETARVRGNIPGLAVAIVVGDELVFAEGFGVGDVDAQWPVTADTPFMWASVSKAVAGTSLMQVVEGGALALDDPIDVHLSFPVDNPHVEGERILVRDLVTHSSSIRDSWAVYGWPGWGGDEGYVWGDSTMPLGDYLRSYFEPGGERYHPSRNWYSSIAPGEAYRYSNFGAALAAHLVEAVTGRSVDDHCDEELFGPLGMEHTGWHLADHPVETVAVPTGLAGNRWVSRDHYGYADYPAGQLRASAADMGRFLAVLLGGGTVGEVTVLAPQTVDSMFRPVAPWVTGDHGVFWYPDTVDGRPVMGHNGSDYGVAAEVWLDRPGGLAIAVVANTDWRADSTQAFAVIEAELFEAGEAWVRQSAR